VQRRRPAADSWVELLRQGLAGAAGRRSMAATLAVQAAVKPGRNPGRSVAADEKRRLSSCFEAPDLRRTQKALDLSLFCRVPAKALLWFPCFAPSHKAWDAG